MERIKEDSRFSHVLSDPRFRGIPKRERKVKIDKRFNAMFKDERFKLKYSVDKRGRPVNYTTTEDLKKYYELSSQSSSSDESEEESSIIACKETNNSSPNKTFSKTKMISRVKEKDVAVENSEQDTNSDTKSKKSLKKQRKKSILNKEEEKPSFKLNRLSKTEKMSDPESSKTSDDEKIIIPIISSKHNLGKQNKNSLSIGSIKKSSKLCLKNDKYEGREGEVIEETNNQSDVSGDEENEMSDESDAGAASIDFARGEGNVESSSNTDDDTSEEEVEEGSSCHPWGELDVDAPEAEEITHRLAVCNMNWDRIKAHDLLLLFNSFKPSTGVIKSVKIYPTEFGKERMKEDDVKGPHELVEETISESEEETPEGSKFHMEKLRKYQINRLKYYYAVLECDSPATANKIYEECDGVEYESSATRLDLRFIPNSMTFDEEPHSVVDTLNNVDTYRPNLFTTTALQQAKVDLTWDETDPDRIQATQEAFNKRELENIDLKAYLASGSEDEEELVEQENGDEKNNHLKDKNDKGSSISKYRVLLKSIEEEEKKKLENDVQMEITWEPGLREAAEEIVKKKEESLEELTPWEKYLKKKKEKKLMKKKEKQEHSKIIQEPPNPYSDDELPSDVDVNDKFFSENLNSDSQKKREKKKKKHRKKDVTETEEDKRKKAELELLLLDENDNTRHFRLDNLIQNEKGDKHKKKTKNEINVDDDFQVDVNDPRFSALYSSHLYNVDPSDHQFKRTKGMEAIIEEKQRKRLNEDSQKTNSDNLQSDHTHHELLALIKSVKRKSSSLHTKKEQNKKKK